MALDVFQIETAMTTGDRKTLLRLRSLVSEIHGPYAYLEVGSDMGGSLLPFLNDDLCQTVVSVDLRPAEVPDERGVTFVFEENTTAAMLQRLATYVADEQLAKLVTFDCDIADLGTSDLSSTVDLAFIDGEHTNIACFSDFVHLLPHMSADGLIAFHDANLISDAIQNIEQMLTYCSIEFRTLFCPTTLQLSGSVLRAASSRCSPMPRTIAPRMSQRSEESASTPSSTCARIRHRCGRASCSQIRRSCSAQSAASREDDFDGSYQDRQVENW